MPTQSIDLSEVTAVTYDGSAVEQINLNGVSVWIGGNYFELFYDATVTTYGNVHNQGETCHPWGGSISHPIDNRWFYVMQQAAGSPVPSVANIDGVIYLGMMQTYNSSSIWENLELANPVPNRPAPGSLDGIWTSSIHHNMIDDYGQMGETFWAYATINRETGFVPIDASTHTANWDENVCTSHDQYGNCLAYGVVPQVASWTITATSVDFNGMTVNIDLSTGMLDYVQHSKCCVEYAHPKELVYIPPSA